MLGFAFILHFSSILNLDVLSTKTFVHFAFFSPFVRLRLIAAFQADCSIEALDRQWKARASSSFKQTSASTTLTPTTTTTTATAAVPQLEGDRKL